MKICPKCNCEYEDDVNFCKKDGSRLEVKAEVIVCPHCGKALEAGSKFCNNCGKPVDGNEEETSVTPKVNKCPECGAENAVEAAFCGSCGCSLVKEKTVYKCINCNTEYPGTQKFCTKCGGKVVNESDPLGLYEDGKIRMVKIPHKNFEMLSVPVTQELYENVVGENPSHFAGENLPVENVSWYDALYFCNRLSVMYGLEPVYYIRKEITEKGFFGKEKVIGSQDIFDTDEWNSVPHSGNLEICTAEDKKGFRLPTVEEWKYAAKGGKNYTYAGSDNLDEVGWHDANSNDMTHEVGLKKANGYGLYDMSGNVWEWCWGAYSSGDRYCCGGSCRNYDGNCKVGSRSDGNADNQYSSIGFRIVCSCR